MNSTKHLTVPVAGMILSLLLLTLTPVASCAAVGFACLR